MESMADFEKELERSFRKIRRGDIIEGMAISVTEEEVILDLNYYTQGIIKAENFSDDPGFKVLEEIHVGDTIQAMVIRMDDGQGNMELSRKEANDVLVWDKLQAMMDEETIVTVTVRQSVNAGVIAYLEGVRGFIPASQISLDYVEDTEVWVGKQLDVKVIGVEADKKRLVLSAKAVARERQEEERNHRISMLVPGTVLEGTVESLMPYGAFVALGHGMSGLVHISQIAPKRIRHPHDVLEEGQKVFVKILNTNEGKISLTMKDLEENRSEEDEDDFDVDVSQYNDDEDIGTSLGGLLAGFKMK